MPVKAPSPAGTWRLAALPGVEAELQRDGKWTLWVVEPAPNGRGRLSRRMTVAEAGGPISGEEGRAEMMKALDRVVAHRAKGQT